MKYAWQTLAPFGGHPFLDFLNSIDEEDKQRSASALPDWPALLSWAVTFELLDQQEASELQTWPDKRADAEYQRLLELRETGYRVFSALAAQREPDATDLDELAQTAAMAVVASKLVAQDGKALNWQVDRTAKQSLVAVRLGLELLDLLSHSDLSRLKECGRCTGLFLDHGRGRGRRWCRMQSCGNREKVARHRAR
ncbi:CGNR zinc finger domain-containing protein [Saccharospirillum sp. HFRX-1]|uniref:CGNR zinc finger domain-containing protein n=1 Tax=unclassified Saccharospirillum TaxID=2633430 RepID=UPI0037184E85